MNKVEYKTSASATSYTSPGGSSGESFTFSTVPDTAYTVRVVATAGVSTARSVSSASKHDLAVTVPFVDPLLTAGDAIKAVHITDVRKAVNSICDYLGIARIYSAEATVYTSLQGLPVAASHISELQAHINNLRTNAAIDIGQFDFATAALAV